VASAIENYEASVISELTYKVIAIPRLTKRLIVLSLDLLLCIIATLIAFYLRTGVWTPTINDINSSPSVMMLVSASLSIPIFIAFGLYREIFRYSGSKTVLFISRAILVYSFTFVIIFTVIGFKGIPRTLGIIQPIILFILVVTSRSFASHWLGKAYRSKLKIKNLRKILIYGAGDAGLQLAFALSHSYEVRVVGFLDDDQTKQGQNLLGFRVFDPRKLEDLVENLGVNDVFLAMPSVSRYRRNEILKIVRHAKVPIKTLPSISELAQGKVTIQDLRELDIDDILGRELVAPKVDLIRKNSYQKVVLVTGAGGSIGSELCRQIFEQHPKELILIEHNEYALYMIQAELIGRLSAFKECLPTIIPILASVVNQAHIFNVVKSYRPEIIYHTAAYKHVSLVELNPVEGAKNNILGTLTIAKIAIELGVQNFVLISTDKAVRPTNVMGATKRVAEMILQDLSASISKTTFSMVRFGNVLNSSGSVVPLFHRQIKNGGPLTVTDFRATRFFMTIPEAAQLVIQAGAMSKGGDVFLLDMGDPVRILDLAKRMIELSGLQLMDKANPNGDIAIIEVGLKEGEKLHEELIISGSPQKTDHPKIFKTKDQFNNKINLSEKLILLLKAIEENDIKALISILQYLVPGYSKEDLVAEIED